MDMGATPERSPRHRPEDCGHGADHSILHSCRLATYVDVCPVGQALLAGPEPCTALWNVSSSSILDTSSMATRRSRSSFELSTAGKFLIRAVLHSLVISSNVLMLVICPSASIPRRGSRRTCVRSEDFSNSLSRLFRSKK